MKSNITKSNGFTLIELIVVIVILGIMAAVAGPKFVGLQADAKASVMKGIEGSVRSAATLIYSKSLINGTESGISTVIVTGVGTIDTVEGYPADTTAGNLTIDDLVDLSGTSGKVTASGGVFTYTGSAACTVTYAEPAAANTPPVITPDLTNC